jgi:hypothetical protein
VEPVVRFDAKAGERSLDVMRWGLVPFWAKDIKVGFANINAKAEGIESKPAFRNAKLATKPLVHRRRKWPCLRWSSAAARPVLGIANVTAETIRPLIVTVASRKSHLRTDESGVYWKVGEEFKTHETVVHSADEYVRDDVHTNTVEGYFAILKRGNYGTYHHVSEARAHA